MANPPNIILITADQWRWDCLGNGIGRHPVMTPHLNQLACEGVQFTQAYADCPVCMPSRVTTLTGQVASRFGELFNFPPGVRSPINACTSLPARLRDTGYQTKAIGKMHFSPDRARFGFEHISLHPNDYVNWLEENGYGGFYRGHGLGGNEVYPAVSAVPERYTHTHWIIDEGIRFLSQKDPENPFFLWMVFEAPHSPFDPPEPYDRLYDHFTIPDPVLGDWVNEHDYPAALHEKRLVRKYDQLTPEIVRESRRRYYGQLTYIDYQLARLWGELRTLGLYENTIIVFTADHGETLGDHGLFDKYTFLNASARIPLIMRLPRQFSGVTPGSLYTGPVQTADLYPTLLDLAGSRWDPAAVDGMSLVAGLQAPAAPAERVICGETDHSAFVTDAHYKYIVYLQGGTEQLFDVQNDPDDLNNLIASEVLTAELTRLKAALIAYLERYQRPIVQGGKFIFQPVSANEPAARATNDMAWRGPLRYGRGY